MLSKQVEISLPAGFISALAATTIQQQVLDITSMWMPRIIPVRRASIATPRDRTTLVINAIGGDAVMASGALLPIRESLVGLAFASQKLVKIDDLTTVESAEAATLRGAGLRSCIIAPMVSHGRSLGTINLGNSEKQYFTQDHEDLLQCIALLVGSFLHIHETAKTAQVQAETDDLTGVLARNAILKQVENSLTESPQPTALLFIDFDGFKTVNDAHGHRIGDELLRALTERIQRCLKVDEQIGRLGGDEFLVLIPSSDRDRVLEVGRDLIESCSQPVVLGKIHIELELSIGVAVSDESTIDADQLLSTADQAMYKAKNSKDTLVIADIGLQERVALTAVLDRELSSAMNDGSMRFEYQPLRDMASGELRGAEALLRWNHERFGPINPELIVERIQSTGRTQQLTEWTLRTAARDLATFRSQNPACDHVQFGINLTRHQLGWNRYLERHVEICDHYGLGIEDLVIEVVESEAIQPGDSAEATLRRAAEAGVLIALDDFGAGHNALRYFQIFPIHVLKLDRSLVAAMKSSAAARTIIRSLARMSKELGIEALAEGIETGMERDLCVEAGLTLGQGWHFGRPMPLGDLLSLAADEFVHQPVSSREAVRA